MKKKLLIVIAYCISFPLFSAAQNGYGEFNEEIKVSSRKRALKQARRNSENADYTEAIQRYRALLHSEPDNVTYNTELGITLFDSPYQKVMCIPYLEKAISLGKTEEVGELYYPLGIAYRMKGEYEKAVHALGQYLNQLKAYGTYLGPEEESLLTGEVNREIEICNNAKALRTGPPFFLVRDSIEYYPALKRMPAPINTIYDEYSPVFTNNDSTIIFTARRKGSKGEKVNWDGKYFEDIWISDKSGNSWTEPRSIGENINTSGHDAVNSISRDHKKLYIYRADKNGSIMTSDLVSRNTWSDPKRLPGEVNSRAWETSLGVSLYDSVVYFVSDRKGGYGGRDIYISRKGPKGEWLEGVNLGQNINTPFEEDAPYLSPDGKFLYFASAGHNTMGGFDVYRSEWVNNGWGAPENLGAPINTENHDIYFSIDDKGNASLSSQRITNDTLNDMNLYEVIFECKGILATTLNGAVKDGETKQPLKASIVVLDEGNQKYTSADSDTKGFYKLNLAPEKKYQLIISAETFQPETALVFIPKQCKPYEIYQEISIRNLKEGNRNVQQETTVTNGFFDIKRSSGSKGGSSFLADASKYLGTPDAMKQNGYSQEVYKQEIKEGEVVAKGEPIPTEEISFVNIHFDFNSSEIRAEAVETLEKVVSFMKANKDAQIELWGFADSKGSEAYNLKLSERRAQKAREFLARKGISSTRLVIKGFGESNPLETAETEEAMQKNRRVEFKVFPKGKDAKGQKK